MTDNQGESASRVRGAAWSWEDGRTAPTVAVWSGYATQGARTSADLAS